MVRNTGLSKKRLLGDGSGGLDSRKLLGLSKKKFKKVKKNVKKIGKQLKKRPKRL